MHEQVTAILERECAPGVLSARDGTITYQNPSAAARFGPATGASVGQMLDGRLEDAAALCQRLMDSALTHGAAQEEGRAPTGENIGITVLRLYNDSTLLWRIWEPDAPLTRPARAALDTLPIALAEIGEGGRIAHLNQRARALLSPPDAGPDTGATALSDLVEGPGRPVRSWVDDALRGYGLDKAETLRVRHADRETFVQVSLSGFAGPGSGRLLATFTDATALKTLEAQIVQSQKMQAIGQLAGGIAHDFNNLLTAISGHCDLLLATRGRNDPDHANLQQINENANRAAGLVGQLLAFSRKQTLRAEILDLGQVLSGMTHLLGRLVGEKVALSVSTGPGLNSVCADRRQMEQVLMNLVVNARDAMPGGGRIEVRTETRCLDRPLLRDHAEVPAGRYVTISVRDHGTGMPGDVRAKIFEPFFTTKKTGQGTGLGLSMAYGIVKQSGGFIFVDSDEGQGATFTIYLPAREDAPPQADDKPVARARKPARSGASGKGVVLLVEDEAPVRAFAARALRMYGYEVLEAGSAEEALESLQDKALCVDLFVTDVVMPGLDGPGWVRQALRDRPGVRVIFVSGYAEDVFGENGSQVPGAAFLAKPFSLAELIEAVKGQLE